MAGATSRVEHLVRQRHRLAMDAALPDAMQAEVAQTMKRLRAKAAALVEKNMPAIERVAAALAKGAPLDQAQIDALIET